MKTENAYIPMSLRQRRESLVEVKSGSRPVLGRIAQIVAVGPSCVYSRWVTEVWYHCLIDTMKEKRRGWQYEKVMTYK